MFFLAEHIDSLLTKLNRSLSFLQMDPLFERKILLSLLLI